ncbi:MAG: magnesium transporter [Candidatus Izemoplasmatales bacterium]|nr:magnesium transporter [Candidatus Izemoplasmatales bacterium]
MEDLIKEILPEEEIINIILNVDDEEVLKEQLDLYYDYEIAKALLVLEPNSRKKLYRTLPIRKLTDVFEELTPEDAFSILKETNIETIVKIFKEMETDDLVDIIDVIDDREDRITYLSLIDVNKRVIIKSLLDFDQGLVGSIMNNDFIFISKRFTVKQAIKKVVSLAPEIEFIHNIFITDENGILEGAISLKELISAGYDQTQLIEDLMSINLKYVTPSTDIEDAIEIMKNYDFLLLPVVDKYNKLIGIISYDDILEALNEESDEDYSSLAGLSEVSIDEKETVFETIKKRLPWLIIILFINLFTSSIIIGFEGQLKLLPTLAIFMPLILDMAGNTGTQSLGIVIRLFATNQLDHRKAISKHILNEFFTGLVNGLIIGVGLFIMVIIFNLIKGQDFSIGLTFALVVALSITIALIVATLAGTLVPLIINSLKIDPAVASGPFITTINDILSLLIYFGLASILIQSLM